MSRVVRILKNHGVNTALDTSLYAPWEKIKPLLPLTDTFLVDLKHPTPQPIGF
ncbi:MAG: hypothetical protein ACLUSP_11130 [Christensenellales bacterium]